MADEIKTVSSGSWDDIYRKFAAEQNDVDKPFTKEAGDVSTRTRIDAYVGEYISHYEALTSLYRGKQQWGEFEAPQGYQKLSGRLYTHYLVLILKRLTLHYAVLFLFVYSFSIKSEALKY